ncbi:MAG: prolyl oligopeptidase family serine peptidase [Rubricoccaceae bacterium]|nr:prolyl oligopeptidase family serine peptidase [Rubricoccaceae bacterium]
MRRRPALLLLALLVVLPARAQERPRLTVDQITQDPETWIGAWPSAPYWTDAGDFVYFEWNPQGRFEADSLFRAPVAGGEPERVPVSEQRHLPPRFSGWHADRRAYDGDFALHVFERDGDLYLYFLDAYQLVQLTDTAEREADPSLSWFGDVVYFTRGDNLFALDRRLTRIEQLTDLRSGSEPTDEEPSEGEAFLEDQQLRLFDVLRERARRDSLREAAEERSARDDGRPTPFYTGDRSVRQLTLSPDARFATFVLAEDDGATDTRLVDYVTRSGYAEEITARPKVGAPSGAATMYVQDLQRDTTYAVDLTTLPGAFDPPDYARADGATADSSRTLYAWGPYWNYDGSLAVLEVRTRDNKDRWIARLDPASGTVTSLDRQRDEAWIAGPGISWWGGPSSVGWMADGERFWFQSEASGYSHLYTVDVATGRVEQLTDGAFEVSDPVLSKDGQTWFFQSSEGSPHERHVYTMPADGGPRTRVTRLAGRNDFSLSPDERHLALLHSTSNRPPTVVLEPAEAAEAGRQAPVRYVTDVPTEAWLDAYPWQEAEIVTVPADDGAEVPARIYRPEAHGAEPNGAAVLFVHGAGYLQNVHNWWSSYYREWMFHHLLAQRGYLVLDLDYRASAGYGRDWRTAVYRHMGGRDLADYVDASRWVGEAFGIPPERVAIYGGSYGGFLTLMALFTAPEHFGGGAALRSVTDWAHYNHVYTSNILNTPTEDPEAFARSSPIEFADGLEDPLLMTHGLIDDNVQPQDIFRLSQRLIELGKGDWELAIAPVEPHSYVEPTSWADKLRRILDLIEHSVGPERGGDETEG